MHIHMQTYRNHCSRTLGATLLPDLVWSFERRAPTAEFQHRSTRQSGLAPYSAITHPEYREECVGRRAYCHEYVIPPRMQRQVLP